MSEAATGDVKERPDSGAMLAVATPDEDERLRTLIRAELDRHYALPVARRTLELIVETAAEPAVGSPGYRIVDRNGETRLRPVEPEPPAKAKKKPRKGEKPAEEPKAPTVPMTLAELVEELRTQHPDLFGTPPPEPEPPPPTPEHHASVGETVAHVRAAGAKFVETQTALAKSLAASSAEHGRALAAAAGETVESWRHQLDEKLKTHRTPETESKAVDEALPAVAPTAVEASTLSVPALATQPRRAWASFGRGAVVRLRAGGEAFRARLRRRSEVAPAGFSAPIPVPTLREVTRDLLRRRLMVAGLGGATILTGAFAASVLMRDHGTGAATQESPLPDKPTQQAEATPPAQPPVAQEAPPPQAAAPTSPPADPEEQPDEPKQADPNAVVGVPEVIDTATLRVSGKLVRLFGVEWVRGGQSDELAKYLAGRPVTCKPAPGSGAYLCTVNGRDLSEVVLFNGGGRASPEATPDLVAAEDRARSERIGVWKR